MIRQKSLTALVILVLFWGAASADPLQVYVDSLLNGFEDWSWATHNLGQTAVVHTGGSAVSFEPDSWGGLYFHRSAGIDVNAYDRLEFWVHGGASGGQAVRLALLIGGSSAGSARVDTFITGGAIPAGQWVKVTVPFASLGLTTGILDGFWFMADTAGDQPTLYLDDLSFLEREGGPPTGETVSVSVDPALDRRAVNPHIFGVNFGTDEAVARMKYPLRRWGGNSTTRYSWQDDADNRGSDWFFFSYPHDNDHPEQLPDNSDADRFIDATRAAGAQPLVTLPLIGWTARDRTRRWSFSVAKYGAQQETECTATGWASWCTADAGNGRHPDGTLITGNDPDDACREVGPSFVTGWTAHIAGRTGTAGNGGVKFYALDNEPMLWNSTHRDVHPSGVTYDELWQRTLLYAGAVKALDPDVQIFGPVVWGWCAYFYSAADGCSAGADAAAHGGMAFLPWYLQQVEAHRVSTGVRLVDYLDVHFYPQASGVFGGGEEYAAVRLRSVKGLYDPAYVDESWIGQPVRLIPRLREWVAQYAPGTKIAVTEYSWGDDNLPSTALAEAEALAVFAREGVDAATRWVAPRPGNRAEDAFSLYLNYDGAGSRVAGESVRALSGNVDRVGAYAVRGAGGKLFLLLFNKDTVAHPAAVSVTGSFTGDLQLYRFDASNRLAPAGAVTPSDAGSCTVNLPARSATLAVAPWSESGGALAGDLNDDHALTAADALLLAALLAGQLDGMASPFPAPLARADLNLDGRIDAADLVLLARALTR
ncbi:MAG: endoglucanase [Acidobacteria bacterium]|nr:endoglucanase [Acidobacteriota bacterium]